MNDDDIFCPVCFEHDIDVIRASGGFSRVGVFESNLLVGNPTRIYKTETPGVLHCGVCNERFDILDKVSQNQIQEYYYGTSRRNNRKLLKIALRAGIKSAT